MKITNLFKSSDCITTKFVQVTNDNYHIETTYVDYYNKHIICYSTQIGCNKGCKICYNGIKHNFIRNLELDEIVYQIINVIEYMRINITDEPILFSAMGIGEPLDNYENYISSIYILEYKYQGSRFALATCGSNLNNIYNLAHDIMDIDLKLVISLHSAIWRTRRILIPTSSHINDIIYYTEKFKEISNKDVEYNITLIDGINDTDEDAKAICRLFYIHNILNTAYMKINKFNAISNSKFKPSKRVEEFIGILKSFGANVEYYETNGSDINAACGQMISK